MLLPVCLELSRSNLCEQIMKVKVPLLDEALELADVQLEQLNTAMKEWWRRMTAMRTE